MIPHLKTKCGVQIKKKGKRNALGPSVLLVLLRCFLLAPRQIGSNLGGSSVCVVKKTKRSEAASTLQDLFKRPLESC